jgi:four helix bundle protein
MEVGYKKLVAWQNADNLASLVYKVTRRFPRSEQFDLTPQLRRAALPVPTNIVEGYARNARAEFKRFLAISLGSLSETRYLLEFSLKEEFLREKDFKEVIELSQTCGQIIWKFDKSLGK